MEEVKCSLKSVNNADCHSFIRGGNCPGFSKGVCVNIVSLNKLDWVLFKSGVRCDGSTKISMCSTRKDTEYCISMMMKKFKKNQNRKNK